MNTKDVKLGEDLHLMGELEAFRATGLYQALIKPLEEEREQLRHAYDCETLEEMARLRGYKAGLDFVSDLMAQIETRGERAREAKVEREEQERRANLPIDSTTL